MSSVKELFTDLSLSEKPTVSQSGAINTLILKGSVIVPNKLSIIKSPQDAAIQLARIFQKELAQALTYGVPKAQADSNEYGFGCSLTTDVICSVRDEKAKVEFNCVSSMDFGQRDDSMTQAAIACELADRLIRYTPENVVNAVAVNILISCGWEFNQRQADVGVYNPLQMSGSVYERDDYPQKV